ncbi:gliding motility-associated C-terminal domain-containing protein [Tenacibaculum sp. M341]|uniref:T9SS type B sorting domain-containing protein n=1 Tax=Tenacibaculum sp. M341 TaxID=2530339 RepID=UPI00104E3942|nr:gliding motility-associated C-terminal domain-containing protein [Tenacibaculum sp. M341]TCI85250.1 hypothetical protein EYW44_17550 [Tenacibaculum sp. M341]
MSKNIKKEKLLILLFCLLCTICTYGQRILKPVLETSTNCKTLRNRSIEFTLEFRGDFPDDNEFIMQLSDESGDFTSPTILGRINDRNDDPFGTGGVVRFDIPIGTRGDDYRLRIVSSTDTSIESPESDKFAAYFIEEEDMTLVTEDQAQVLCAGETVTLALKNPNAEYEYVWYKDFTEIPGEVQSSLVITEPGQYQVFVNYGNCNGTTPAIANSSLRIPVTRATAPSGLRIEAPSSNIVELCANESFELKSSVIDQSYTYKWYKDGSEIRGINSETYTPPIGNQFGVFHLEVLVGNCVTRSMNDVTIRQRASANFDIGIEGPATIVRLPRESPVLKLTNVPSNSTITWFNGTRQLDGSNVTEWLAVEEGEYRAVVVDNSFTCPVSDTSPIVTVLDVVSINPKIRHKNSYRDCSNASTDIEIEGIEVGATDGNTYNLSFEQINHPDYIRYKWFKEGSEIIGETSTFLSLASYNENGTYTLEANASPSVIDRSEDLDTLLTLENVEILSSSVSNTLCPGGEITFEVDLTSGFTYRWFKNEEELVVADPSNLKVDEVGVYTLSYEGFGCLVSLPEIEVKEFDETVLQVTPSSTALLNPGETVRFQASGADSYEWYNESGVLLSSTDVLEVDILGNYTLVGFVDSCRVEKELKVVEDDGKLMIPNILSPLNDDGVNDTWELPNKFAFQTDVNVVIYNSNGKEVLNTNDYQNDWPLENNLKEGMLFYFKVIKNENLVKAGTISILQ